MTTSRGIHAPFQSVAVRHALLVLRKPLGVAIALLVAAYADPDWYLPGLAVSAVGALLQVWCFACIDTSRTLAVHGPYALVRNPMYLARYLLIVGALAFVGQPWLLVAFTPLYYLYMHNRVAREEAKLARLFGAPFDAYRAVVRRFVPSLRPYPGARVLYWDFACLRRNHGLANLAFVVVFYVVAGFFAFT